LENKKDFGQFMTPAQLQSELLRCEYCEEKPCKEACPAHCSPADFIMAARIGKPSDIRRSAGEIMHANPLGGICGMVCPDTLCMSACTRKIFDGAINIPLVQATIINMAKTMGGIPDFSIPTPSGKKVAIIGSGPAGLGAAAALAQMGHQVEILEATDKLGGMVNLIPHHRLDKMVIDTDIKFVLSLGNIKTKTGIKVSDPKALLDNGYDAVCVATGLWKPITLGLENEDLAVSMVDLLAHPQNYQFGGRVAIIGGGATAVDCAITARQIGANHVELFMLEKLSEMPLTARERKELLDFDIEINCRFRTTKILKEGETISGLQTVKVELPAGNLFSPANVRNLPETEAIRTGFNAVVVSIGMRSEFKQELLKGLFYAGDVITGPKTVVQAVASGKNAAIEIDAYLKGENKPVIEKLTKSYYLLPGFRRVPVSLETEFFGRPIISPYLISASPSTDGSQQMTRAYKAGWAGGVMKTAFDNLPIHIPGEYMFAFSPLTYGNSDNVSGHPLDRVCREVEQLVREWPDRLTMASTGGPVSGQDEHDATGWQSNTRKLEAAGAMAIE
jgi:dihydropyrimidine dehydrogenase (NAD+) subunit PreT